VSQWIDVVEAMGAKYAWLTAKHGCGFLLWPTNTTLPDGSPYGYDVSAPDCPTHVDIVKVWMDELRSRGIGPGLYYSLKVRMQALQPSRLDYRLCGGLPC
jgi:alpha-L-fucosidase